MSDEFGEMRRRIEKVFGTLDDTIVIVLKGHLLIEEMLDSIIKSFVFHSEYIDDAHLRFTQKVQIARSLSIDEHENGMWDIATRLNTLRNDFAHALDSDKRQRKISAVVEAYFREADEAEHIELVKSQDEHVILALAAAYFVGFLGSFKMEVQRFRALVDGIDLIMNPHRHQPNTN